MNKLKAQEIADKAVWEAFGPEGFGYRGALAVLKEKLASLIAHYIPENELAAGVMAKSFILPIRNIAACFPCGSSHDEDRLTKSIASHYLNFCTFLNAVVVENVTDVIHPDAPKRRAETACEA